MRTSTKYARCASGRGEGNDCSDVVAIAPTKLAGKQRFVPKQFVEQHATRRFQAIFALGYWAGLRISEIAALRVDQFHMNQRAGRITVMDAKGGKTRTLDLHNMTRRALRVIPHSSSQKLRSKPSAV